MRGGQRPEVDPGGDEQQVDDGEDAGGQGDPGLDPHNGVEAEDAGEGGQAHGEQEADDLGARPVVPSQGLQDGGRGEGGGHAQDGLLADGEHPGDGRGQAVAVVAEGGARQGQGGGAAALAQDGDHAARQEGDDDAPQPSGAL